MKKIGGDVTDYFIKTVDEDRISIDSNSNNYTATTSDANIATFAKLTEDDQGSIKVKAGTKTGKATITIKEGDVARATIEIEVKDTTPKLTKINVNKIDPLNFKLNEETSYDVINNLFKITNSYGKKIVEGLSMSGTSGEVVFDSVSGTFKIGDLTIANVVVTTDFGVVPKQDGIVKVPTSSKLESGKIIVKVYHGESASGNPFDSYEVDVNVN